MPNDPKVLARVLSPADIDTLLARLRDRDGDRWTALSTFFHVTAGYNERDVIAFIDVSPSPRRQST